MSEASLLTVLQWLPNKFLGTARMHFASTHLSFSGEALSMHISWSWQPDAGPIPHANE
jgi:hypothetical protein